MFARSLLIRAALLSLLLAGGSSTALAAKSDFPPPAQRIEADPPPPTILQRVDKAFGKAVEGMAVVLFYRLGSSEEEYIAFNQAQFYRPRSSDEASAKRSKIPYKQHGGEKTLSVADVRRLQALDQMSQRQPGLLGEEQVEFVTLTENKYKYIKTADGNFRKQEELREQLSKKESITAKQARELALQGRLKLDEEKLKEGDSEPYILTNKKGGAPLVVVWLALGAVYFTIYMRGYNIWGFAHAVQIVRGKYDNPKEPGEVTHFQALASALSATVGLGNIAGVTIAMTQGGPGAFFWMLLCGLFGMTSKFVECTLGQKYRTVKPDGTVLGGPMQYLHAGLKQLGLGPFGFVLSIAFAIMCILASFGGGNMFQANQSGQQMLAMLQLNKYSELENIGTEIKAAAAQEDDDALVRLQQQKASIEEEMKDFSKWFLPAYGVVLAILVGLVIIGGIRRIGAAAEKLVPSMCLIYMATCIWIILNHYKQVPELIVQIFTEAFTPEAFGGGLIGVAVIGIQRAAFSNEAGVGSASIAHSAAKTEEPVREGTVALMGPFIDTIVVCSMTALVILITGAWENTTWIIDQGRMGTPLTSKAFASEISWFPYVLSIAVVLFAYSTLISWSYYGERCWERLFGANTIIAYRAIYVGAVFVGSVVNLGAVLDFSDMMILSMAFPNILGLVLLTPQVRRDLVDYWSRYKAGTFKTYK